MTHIFDETETQNLREFELCLMVRSCSHTKAQQRKGHIHYQWPRNYDREKALVKTDNDDGTVSERLAEDLTPFENGTTHDQAILEMQRLEVEAGRGVLIVG